MKTTYSTSLLVAAFFGVMTPLVLVGCGGGASNLPPSDTKPLVAQTSESIGPQQFRLKTGQLVSFFLQTYAGETRVTGNGQIFGFGPVGSRPPGRIDIVDATRTGPRDFVGTTASFNDNFRFHLATATEPGSFTIGPPGAPESGVIVPTSQVQPTPTPTTPPGPARFDLMVVASSDSNYGDVPFNFASLARTSSNTLGVFAGGSLLSTGPSVNLIFADLPLRVGATINAATARQNALTSHEYRGESRGFQARSGQLELTALSGNTATVTFRNVVYKRFNEQSSARGTVTIDGTVTGPFEAAN